MLATPSGCEAELKISRDHSKTCFLRTRMTEDGIMKLSNSGNETQDEYCAAFVPKEKTRRLRRGREAAEVCNILLLTSAISAAEYAGDIVTLLTANGTSVFQPCTLVTGYPYGCGALVLMLRALRKSCFGFGILGYM